MPARAHEALPGHRPGATKAGRTPPRSCCCVGQRISYHQAGLLRRPATAPEPVALVPCHTLQTPHHLAAGDFQVVVVADGGVDEARRVEAPVGTADNDSCSEASLSWVGIAPAEALWHPPVFLGQSALPSAEEQRGHAVPLSRQRFTSSEQQPSYGALVLLGRQIHPVIGGNCTEVQVQDGPHLSSQTTVVSPSRDTASHHNITLFRKSLLTM